MKTFCNLLEVTDPFGNVNQPAVFHKEGQQHDYEIGANR